MVMRQSFIHLTPSYSAGLLHHVELAGGVHERVEPTYLDNRSSEWHRHKISHLMERKASPELSGDLENVPFSDLTCSFSRAKNTITFGVLKIPVTHTAH